MPKEFNPAEQLQGVWDGVYQEARRCFGIFSPEIDLEIRLVRPSVSKDNIQWHPWAKGVLVDETGHLISRILVVGSKAVGVKEGKMRAHFLIDNHGTECLFVIWKSLMLNGLALARLGDRWRLRLGEGGDGEISRERILFTEVLLPNTQTDLLRGVAVASVLPKGFKAVFNHETGMMIGRPS